jgi:hypothetical protein
MKKQIPEKFTPPPPSSSSLSEGEEKDRWHVEKAKNTCFATKKMIKDDEQISSLSLNIMSNYIFKSSNYFS